MAKQKVDPATLTLTEEVRLFSMSATQIIEFKEGFGDTSMFRKCVGTLASFAVILNLNTHVNV